MISGGTTTSAAPLAKQVRNCSSEASKLGESA
ncbi:Uncharacterised protein [Mycobacteroides abscessus subsp. abscessus]|nr:Uncharacterised protein [Mycobacteroides abscessus subsp. abscessus]